MRMVYVAHPLGADTPAGVAANLASAKRWYRWCLDAAPDVAFVANWIVDCEVYAADGTNADVLNGGPEHPARVLGLQRDDEVIRRCDEMWLVGGRISSGMRRGVALAHDLKLHIVDLTHLLAIPPIWCSFADLIRRDQPRTWCGTWCELA